MTMQMTTNLKLLGDTTSEIVDATLYRHMIGSLMYLTNTRPNICFAVNTLSQYMVEPRHVHLIAAKHVLRYLKGTNDYGLRSVADCEFDWWAIQIQIGPIVSLNRRAPRMLLQFRVSSDCVAQQEEDKYGAQYY